VLKVLYSRRHLTKGIVWQLTVVVFMFMVSTILMVTLFSATILDGTLLGIYFNRGVRARILMWPRNMNVRVQNYVFEAAASELFAAVD
jgi:phosphoglycerol transferase MdoB-like AlkP superfamily enzyme